MFFNATLTSQEERRTTKPNGTVIEQRFTHKMEVQGMVIQDPSAASGAASAASISAFQSSGAAVSDATGPGLPGLRIFDAWDPPPRMSS